MRGRLVQTPRPIHHGIHKKPTPKSPRGILRPLMKVAHHVEDPVFADAARVGAGVVEALGQLIEAGVVELGPDPVCVGLEVLDRRMAGGV